MKCKHKFIKLLKKQRYWYLVLWVNEDEEYMVCEKCGKIIKLDALESTNVKEKLS